MAIRERLRHWFTKPLGQQLLELEQLSINQVLSNLFGYHIIQLGCLSGGDFLTGSRISHKLVMQLEQDGEQLGHTALISSSDALALAPDCMDVVVLPHVLEFSANPHKVLREVERVLIGEGHLILLGFNPLSLWGLWRVFLAWYDEPPWNGHFYGLPRLKDWLSLLDFEIINIERLFFRPPLQKLRILRKLSLLEKLGRYCWPYFGGVYLVVAKKRVIPLTPIKMDWRDKRKMVTSGLAEPSANMQDHRCK